MGTSIMRISLLDANSMGRRLKALIGKHDHISMAVAWGQLTDVADTLLAHKARIETVLIGLDFSATDPDLVDRLVGVRGAYVAKNRPGCFHPKIYYFTTDMKAEAIVGSANFTGGGLGKNFEASVHVKGNIDDAFFAQIRDQFDAYKPLHLPITKSLATSYRRQAEAALSKPRPRNPTLPDEKKSFERFNAALSTMSWATFTEKARADRHHDFTKRMKLLRIIQQMFVKAVSIADLSVVEWKGIAGTIGEGEAFEAGLDDLDWGWFGSMGGAGTFAQLIGEQNAELAAALDMIPRRGDVTEDQFNKYVGAFTASFLGRARIARLAPATRLLAMKRPDVFVCVNGENRRGIAEALAFAPTTLNLENYWERVIEPIRQAPWYTTPRPTDRNRDLWDARVAMLDAIYYAPSR
ncbi:restriction endonuclease PLD domain-containing protein [Azorhizobium doebereinerae]|uniref:restriction endonuclease PLD domain-containing protein n=1 Tax=Azorhizobium doebereinerae TaxID=281091 RepID=UPI0012EB46E6|nr:phospholipase D-like domain-containing protein [Azorhizobium doebereinerae]